MKNIIQTIEQSGWTGLILYALTFMAILLFMELNDKKQNKIFVNGQWVENDFDPIGLRAFILGCIAIAGLCVFFIARFFIK